MRNKELFIASLAVGFVIVFAGMPSVGHHDVREDDRIVQPYGVRVITHIPIIAGYEPVPAPVVCQPGQALPDSVYREDFSGDHGWTFIETPLAADSPNLWNVTSYAGVGSHAGPSGGDRLYFGIPEEDPFGIQGTYFVHNDERRHVAGTAQSPPIHLPEAASLVLSFASKWAVEWLKGYDHMWIEMEDEAGDVHLLCSNNSLDRPDGSSQGDAHRIGSCSPILFGPCPTGRIGSDPNEFPVDSLPAWETRMVAVPTALAGQEVRLRFTFDASDPVANQFMGWMVDDVRIHAL